MRRCFRAFLVSLLVATFFVSLPTRNCMAVTSIPYNTIIWGPSPKFFGLIDQTTVIVCARNRFAAAMTILGYGVRVDSLTADQMAYLSNGSTGGEFFTFANNVGHRDGLKFDNYDDLYGYENVWSCVYSSTEYALALRDLETVLNGGGSSGGGQTVLDGFKPLAVDDIPGSFYFGSSDSVNYYERINGVTLEGKGTVSVSELMQNFTHTLYITDRFYDTISNQLQAAGGTGKDRFYGGISNVDINSNVTSSLLINIAMSSAENYTFNVSEHSNGVSITKPWGVYYWSQLKSVYFIKIGDKYSLIMPNSYEISSFSINATNLNFKLWSFSFADGTVPVPPSNWPSAPEVTEPTAPEVPSPTEPDLPTQPSTPTAPTLPDFPSNVIVPGTTYETFDIQAILDAMDEHCQHIQSAVYQGFSDYFDTFTPWLRDEFSTLRTFLREEDDWIVESISDEFMELRSYLKELAEWLADQMDFTITGGDYDDSTVVSWLKKIYYKLGGASVNTKPVDPVGDPDGSWDWLSQLIEAILSALANGAAGLAGTLGDLFQGIKDKFPFSIPWDIVAIVALLDAPPVTPAAVIEYDVFGAHVRYDIDLHFFDEQASVIRAMEDVLFCAFLLFKTDWLIGIFDGIGGFLGGKLKSTVKGA